MMLKEEAAASVKSEQLREIQAEEQRAKQIAERKKAALQSQMFAVTSSYRRTQAELNTLIVEVLYFVPFLL
jgi:hypothetical protein